jgi:hypothetical protein
VYPARAGGEGDAFLCAQLEKHALELGADIRRVDVRRQRRIKRRQSALPVAAGAQFDQLGDAQYAQPIRLLEGAREGGGVDGLREVEQGAGDGGGGDSVDPGPVGPKKMTGTVDPHAFRPAAPGIRDGHMRVRTRNT